MPWTSTRIETARLTLRAFTEDDKPTISTLLSDPAVRRYLGGPVDRVHVEAIRSTTLGERWGAFCIARRDSSNAIGSCRLQRDRGELEISYDLLATHWGRGLATEAVAAVIDWAWANTPDTSIIAVTQSANARSLGLLDRLGFTPEQQFVEYDAMQTQLRLHRPELRRVGS